MSLASGERSEHATSTSPIPRHGGRAPARPTRITERSECDHEYRTRDCSLGCRHAPVGEVGPELRRVWGRRGARRARGRERRLARHPVRVGRRHDAQRLPRLRVGRDVRAGARVAGRAGRVVVRGVRVGRHRARDRARADPGRFLRRRARRRGRHDTQGIPRAERGRARRRPRLAAVPIARRDEPDLLRSLRAPAHGSLRRDARRLRRT